MHGGIANEVRVKLRYVDSAKIEQRGGRGCWARCDGILVPGGFGVRGTEGKIAAIRYRAASGGCRSSGSAWACRWRSSSSRANMLGLAGANSLEFDEATPHPVVTLMEAQKAVSDKGGDDAPGGVCLLSWCRARWRRGCMARARSSERHRHRYEFNNAYREVCGGADGVLGGESAAGSGGDDRAVRSTRILLGASFTRSSRASRFQPTRSLPGSCEPPWSIETRRGELRRALPPFGSAQ